MATLCNADGSPHPANYFVCPDRTATNPAMRRKSGILVSAGRQPRLQFARKAGRYSYRGSTKAGRVSGKQRKRGAKEQENKVSPNTTAERAGAIASWERSGTRGGWRRHICFEANH